MRTFKVSGVLLRRPQTTALLLVAMLSGQAEAVEYVPTGSVEGTSCKKFVIEHCGPVTVAATLESGEIVPFTGIVFRNVSAFHQKTGVCSVNLKAPEFKGGTFYELKGGAYARVNVEFLRFPCRSR